MYIKARHWFLGLYPTLRGGDKSQDQPVSLAKPASLKLSERHGLKLSGQRVIEENIRHPHVALSN